MEIAWRNIVKTPKSFFRSLRKNTSDRTENSFESRRVLYYKKRNLIERIPFEFEAKTKAADFN